MKTFNNSYEAKAKHFDLIADKLRDRVDVWATRGNAAKVYLVQDDDEWLSLILDSSILLLRTKTRHFHF